MNPDYRSLSKEVRETILEISYAANVGHVGSAFSIVEMLLAIYYGILRDGDRFILSKGHAASALYAVLAKRGLITGKTLRTFCQDGGVLEVHPSVQVPHVEVSTGSLGHGLSIGAGIALGIKMNLEYGVWNMESGKNGKERKTLNSKLQTPNSSPRVFVLLSDAECQEGETWEAALVASQLKLNNLCILLDYNRMQALGKTPPIILIDAFVAA